MNFYKCEYKVYMEHSNMYDSDDEIESSCMVVGADYTDAMKNAVKFIHPGDEGFIEYVKLELIEQNSVGVDVDELCDSFKLSSSFHNEDY